MMNDSAQEDRPRLFELSNENRLAVARLAIGAQPIEFSRLPNWFRLAALKAIREGRLSKPTHRYTSAGWEVLMALPNESGWRDHDGTSRWGSDNRELVYVSEPYGINERKLVEVKRIADAIGCDVSLHANSWHNPGSCFRIVFAERRQQQKSRPSDQRRMRHNSEDRREG